MAKLTTSTQQTSETEAQTILPGEIIIGNLIGIDSLGRPQVSFDGMVGSEPLVAMTTQAVTHQHIGRQVALLFANGQTSQPVIVGLIHNPLTDILENFSISSSAADSPFPEVSVSEAQLPEMTRDEEDQILVDGKRVTIQGAEEVTLKCGKASITLTKSGKILIRGTYLSNRSSGVNRIMGGSVQIN